MSKQTKLFSESAEQAVLGGLLLEGSRYDDVSEELNSRDFYDNTHGLVFDAMGALVAQGRPLDVVSVSDLLQRRDELERVGGIAYLADIAQNTPSAANVVRYAKIVRERAVRRRVLAAGRQLASDAQEVEDIDALVGSSLDALAALQEDDAAPLMSAAELCKLAIGYVDDRYSNPDALGGLPTGFADVDARLQGMKGGDLIVVAGRPGMGKTVYALNVARHVAETTGTALVFAMEMGAQQQALRMVADSGGVPLGRLMSGRIEDDDWAGLTNAARKMAESRLYVDFRAGVSVQQVRSQARRVQRQHGLSLIVIDYLTLMTLPGGETNAVQVGLATRGLKAVAKEMGVPVIVLAQLSRKVEERSNKRPLMSDLRESGAIEQDADVIQMLYRDEYYNPDSPDVGVVEVGTVKHRMGECGTDRLLFQGEYSRMRDLDRAYMPQREKKTARFSGLD